jgi:O-antigen/teichoic acid export membrane protein
LTKTLKETFMVTGTLNKILQRVKGTGSEGTLLRGAGSLLFLNPLGQFISLLVMSIFLPRVMTNESFGIYNVAMTYLQIFVLLSLMGQDTALVRFIPHYAAQNKWGHLRGIIAHSIKYSLMVALTLVVILLGIIYFMSPKLGPEKTYAYLITLPLIPILAFTGIREASLRSLKRVVFSFVPDSIVRPFVLGILALIIFLSTRHIITAPQLMGLSIAAVICSSLLGWFWLYKSLPKATFETTAHYEPGLWLKVSLPLFFISGMNLILKRTDIIMLDWLQGSVQVAFFSNATRFADLATFGLIIVNMIAAPMISELYNKGDRKELQNIITLAARGIFVLTLLISIFLIFAGKFLLSLSGQAFTVAYTPMLILLAGQAVNALSGSVGFIMTMTGHQNQAAMIIAGGAVLNIILNLILIPPLGMIGSAIATAITTALWNIIMLTYVIRKLKLNPTVIQ